MSWRGLGDDSLKAERLTYLVWEPLLYVVPATVGVARSTEKGWTPMAGLWGGWPVAGNCGLRDCFVVTMTLGYRWSGASEFYVTPKLYFIGGFNRGAY
jgi:hypothetical protein